jgi:hypothetical protein
MLLFMPFWLIAWAIFLLSTITEKKPPNSRVHAAGRYRGGTMNTVKLPYFSKEIVARRTDDNIGFIGWRCATGEERSGSVPWRSIRRCCARIKSVGRLEARIKFALTLNKSTAVLIRKRHILVPRLR